MEKVGVADTSCMIACTHSTTIIRQLGLLEKAL